MRSPEDRLLKYAEVEELTHVDHQTPVIRESNAKFEKGLRTKLEVVKTLSNMLQHFEYISIYHMSCIPLIKYHAPS